MRSLLAALLLIALSGCATAVSKVDLSIKYANGDRARMRATCRDTVIGQGFTYSEIQGHCGTLERSTSDTGFSDNAAPVLEALPMPPVIP